MNKENNIYSISKEFNEQLQSTGHFGTFSAKNINNENQYFINIEENNNTNTIRTKYDRNFSLTNPRNLNLNNLNIHNDIENSNLSIDNLKFLPKYFLDIEEALKKQNSNVQGLQETVKQKILEEKKLKSIIDKLKLENSKLLEINEELTNKINKYEDKIKNVNGLFQNEINSLEGKIKDVKILKNQLKKMQEDNYNLINLNKKLSDENYEYINEIKKLKIDIKNHLYEKMKFLKTNNINKEQKLLNNKLNNIINDNKIQIKSLSNENDKLKNIQKDYQTLTNNYKKVSDDNTLYKEKMRKKENIEKKYKELKEKYDKEKFELICQINIWKNNFLSIAKYKLLNYSPNYDQNVINVMKIDEKYIINAPNSIKIFAEKIVKYFKELIDQEKKYNNKNNLELEDYNNKIYNLNNKLIEEKKIRRKIFFNYLDLRGNLAIMCNIRDFSQDEKEQIKIVDKNSQIDTFIINKNNLIVKNNKNNILKYEFDYIFSENNSYQDIYEELYPLIQTIFKGNNIIILSYEQKKNEKGFKFLRDNINNGIIGRCIQDIIYKLNYSNKDKYKSYELSINIFTILKNEIYNLLDESTPVINIKENEDEKYINENIISANIKSFEECDKLFKLSEKYLKHSKNINEKNCSSHYIYSFKIKLVEKEGTIIESSLLFIDFENEIYDIKMGNKDLENVNKENYEINNKKNDFEEKIVAPDNYLFGFLSTLNKNNERDYKDWNKYILLKYLKNYINNKKFKMIFLLNINNDVNEIEQTLEILKLCDGIFPKINEK